jgi:hypothetical protein
MIFRLRSLLRESKSKKRQQGAPRQNRGAYFFGRNHFEL